MLKHESRISNKLQPRFDWACVHQSSEGASYGPSRHWRGLGLSEEVYAVLVLVHSTRFPRIGDKNPIHNTQPFSQLDYEWHRFSMCTAAGTW